MRSKCSLFTAELKTLYFVICSAEELFTLNSNKFRMVYKVDGNPQLDTCDWSMYSNILKGLFNMYLIYFTFIKSVAINKDLIHLLEKFSSC